MDHIDKSHQHLHILANLVNNDGEAIKDNWIGLRSKKTAEKLTQEYQLIPAQGKHIELTYFNSLMQEKKTATKFTRPLPITFRNQQRLTI